MVDKDTELVVVEGAGDHHLVGEEPPCGEGECLPLPELLCCETGRDDADDTADDDDGEVVCRAGETVEEEEGERDGEVVADEALEEELRGEGCRERGESEVRGDSFSRSPAPTDVGEGVRHFFATRLSSSHSPRSLSISIIAVVSLAFCPTLLVSSLVTPRDAPVSLILLIERAEDVFRIIMLREFEVVFAEG